MIDPLLETKCLIPAQRSRIVSRRRLNELFKRAVCVPLTLVSAPPGFGKTTAALAGIRALQAESDVVLAWLALDEYDDEPIRFWRYFSAALRMAIPEIDDALAAPEALPTQPLLALILNAAAAQTKHCLFVLDDYHLITQPEIHEGLIFILEHAPPTLHLLLVTRADPPLPLHRLRTRGQMVELRAADLRFDQAEAAAFLSDVMALSLTDAEVTYLAEQTEGWAAGLQLAGLALQGTPLASAGPARHNLIERLARSNRYILEYLTEEVLARQTEYVQTFLLQTSVLHRLCGPLCDAMTQQSDGQRMLETLARQNLFVIPLGAAEPAGTAGSGGVWFRYHQLFADLLQGQLRQKQPGMVALLHQRAAHWYDEHGDIEAAVEHALLGEDYPHVARLLDDHARAIVMDGRALTIERWLKRVPDTWLQALPRANLAFAWALLLRGRYADTALYLRRAEAALNAEPRSDDRVLRGELYTIQAVLADSQGQADEALTLAQRALASMPPDNLLARAMAHMAMAGALRAMGDVNAAIAAYEQTVALCSAARMPLPELLARAHLSYLCAVQGRLRQAEAVIHPSLASPAHHPAASVVHSALGKVLLEWNQLDAAESHLQQGLALAQQSGHNSALVHNQLLLARLRRAQGDMAGAQVALEAASAQAVQGVPAWVQPLVIAEQALWWLDQGALGPAEQALRGRGTGIDPAEGHVREVLPLVRANLLYHQGLLAEARALLDDVLSVAESDGRVGRVIEALLLRALVHEAGGDKLAAQRDLYNALTLAEPEGYVRVFLDAGEPMAAALAHIDSPYARHLLASFPLAVRRRVAAPPEMVEPLTERETEVLRLMARGLTYQQIADDLVLSINTVRHHVKGIYSKLQVETRTLALEKARALDLL